jgi:hypothetical protein
VWPRLKLWARDKARFVWAHRTKAIGLLSGVGAVIENTLAQYGHYLPDHWRGVFLGIAGMLTFLVGVFNTLSGL